MQRICYFVKRLPDKGWPTLTANRLGPICIPKVNPYVIPTLRLYACYSIRAAQCHRCTSRPVAFNGTPRVYARNVCSKHHAEWCKHAFKRVPLTNKQIRLAERDLLYELNVFPPRLRAHWRKHAYMHMNKRLFTAQQMLYVLYYNRILNSYRENNNIVIKAPDCPTVFRRAEVCKNKCFFFFFFKKPPPE